MVARKAVAVTALALAAAFVGARALTSAPAVAAGDAVPALLADAADGRATVAWVFRAEDCLSCRAPAYRLRALQRLHGGRVRLVLAAVGEPGPLVRNWAARERLDARIVHLSEDEYRRHFGGSPLPALYLAEGDRVVAVWSGAAREADAPELEDHFRDDPDRR